MTVCIRWNYTYGQYRISNWSQNQRHSSGFGWEFVDWSGSYKTGGRNHLAFNSIVVGNFKSCIGIWVVSGCVRNTKAWTRITFQITNPATGAAQWYRSQG